MRRVSSNGGVIALALLAASAACSRSPSEPSSSSSGGGAPRAGAGSSVVTAAARPVEKRCVRPMGQATATPPPAPPGRCPASPDRPPELPRAAVTFPDATSARDGGAKPVAIDVEIAAAPDETARGLMYRTHMDEGHGMLFRLGERTDHTFWMRNTCIPLDMMFIEDDGTIVGIAEGVPTLSDATTSVGCPSTHVLEVNAGWSRRHGVAPGQKVSLPPR